MENLLPKVWVSLKITFIGRVVRVMVGEVVGPMQPEASRSRRRAIISLPLMGTTH
ncbi:hypothetical protein PYCH_05800 [Pyrococcus yayanosii CH1]|uniref:Uncharacterized protein n=1 Tax=Pyrococcus yayanosii (strain CH1 / JCM 16557) TaxID=529709 RepID=F8AI41_PYRYC|nr:hypothetical protein PYCH_05800 [Pyrococcus yayanosii CH1]